MSVELRTDFGGHFCRLKAMRFRGRLSQWVEGEFLFLCSCFFTRFFIGISNCDNKELYEKNLEKTQVHEN